MSRSEFTISPLTLAVLGGISGVFGVQADTTASADGVDSPVGAYAFEALMMAGSNVSGSVPATDSPASRVDANSNASAYYGVPSVFVDQTRTANDVICTGVAIGTRTILTAGHCLDINGAGVGNGTGISAGQVSVKFNGSSVSTLVASTLTLNPAYTGLPSLFDDVAIIQLSSDIPASVPRYRLLPDGILNPAAPDSDVFRIDFVGYGKSGNGSKTTGTSAYTVNEGLTVKRVGANLVESGGTDDEGSGQTEIFRYDFEGTASGPRLDDPPAFGTASYDWYDGNPAHNVYGAASRTLGNTVESMPGPGDSGGPVFVTDASGSLFLAGLTTFRAAVRVGSLDGGYGSIAGGVWLPRYLPWIESVTGVAAPAASLFDDGIPDPPPTPTPDPTPAPGTPGPVPEPSTFVAAITLSLIGFGMWRRRR